MKSAIVWQVWGFEVGAYLAGFTAQVDAIAFSRERNASCAVPSYQVERCIIVNGKAV